MYNYRLKKVICDLSREIVRGSDEQIDEIYSIVEEEYKNRKAEAKAADLGSKE